MKNIFRTQLLLVLLLAAASPVFAQFTPEAKPATPYTSESPKTEYEEWYIPSFDVKITVDKNSILHVSEKIVADFTKLPSRGIFRTIPVEYFPPKGDKIKTHLKIRSVTDKKGEKRTYEVLRNDEPPGTITIRIGDPDIYLDTVETYVIDYDMIGVPLKYPDHDEVYWNVTGNDWDTAILKTSATVLLPEESNPRAIKTLCYTGTYGSSQQNCTSKIASNKEFTFTATQPLDAFEGLTIVAGFEKGIIGDLPLSLKLYYLLLDNWGYLIPLIVFIFLFIKWYRVGRDPKAEKGTIIPQYKPPRDMSAIEVGIITDDTVNPSDVSAELINLATKNYLKIEEIREKDEKEPKDYKFILEKTFENDQTLKDFQKEILRSVFSEDKLGKEVPLSSLEYKFYQKIEVIKKMVYSHLIKENIYPHNPEKIRKVYYSIAGVLAFIILFLMGLWAAENLEHVGIGLALSAIIIAIFGRIMPRKTVKGINTLYEIKGLEEYIVTAEKDRIKFQEDHGILFEKLLPYALCLGIAAKWAKAFEGIYDRPPSWYSGRFDTFNTYYFTNRISRLLISANSTFASAPRSRGGGGSGFGGGFSGGGFGGGGGGRW